jgi:hypothetical protein
MSNDEDDPTVLTKTQARQGVTIRPQIWVLAIAVILAILAMAVLMLWGPGSNVTVPSGGEVPNTSQEKLQ